jgi:hypothetical protein
MSTTNEFDFQEFPRVSVEAKIPSCESILSPTVLNTVSVAIQSPRFQVEHHGIIAGFPMDFPSVATPPRLRKLWV